MGKQAHRRGKHRADRPAGGRLLRRWLHRPLRDRAVLNQRLHAVATLQDSRCDAELRDVFRGLGDVERILARVALRSARPRDLSSLRDTFAALPALREREIVTVFQYERLFDEYLRSALPGLDPVDAVAFSAAVTAVHNHVLRRLLRGTEDIPESVLTDAYDRLMHRFGVHPGGDEAQEDDLVVAVFPRRMPGAEVARRLRESL